MGMKESIKAIAETVLEDLENMGQEATQEARDTALEIAKILELVGQSGASPEMILEGRRTIELKTNTLKFRIADKLVEKRIDGWIIASRMLTRILLRL
jgi:hypothetical protein